MVYTRNGEFSPGQERQRGQRHRPGAAGISAHRQWRLQHRHHDRPQSADRAKRAATPPRPGAIILNLPAELGRARGARRSIRPNPTTYNESTSTTVYDSLGNALPATFYFTQTATPNQWTRQHDRQRHRRSGAAQTLTFTTTGAVTAPAGGGTWRSTASRPPTAHRRMNMTFNFGQSHAIRRRLRRHLDHPERLCHGPAQHGVHRPHRHRLGGVHQRPLHPARATGHGELPQSAGTEAVGRHQLGADLHLRHGGAGHGRLRRVRHASSPAPWKARTSI